jgi:hypothetical protein
MDIIKKKKTGWQNKEFFLLKTNLFIQTNQNGCHKEILEMLATLCDTEQCARDFHQADVNAVA